ncbi:hypothetical protein [Paeniglutamicibacter cryotolerans]|uniref:Ca2+/Na+ antiporter n=1 Tax=Paeniglutamicibacter cryotolerans TaxID=670079 RepID=A0A839QI65_9MICC|nr:hypothetical protein [Paeniglutamicibacter cryotolerans]MBB2996088.1 Ca2+/Na+ antiporter [Paeniglutamicibacter cryotolerans]
MMSLLPVAMIILVPLCAIVLIAGLFARPRARVTATEAAGLLPPEREAELAAKRRRQVLAMAAAMIAGFVVCGAVASRGPVDTGLMGLPFALAIPLGAIAGLLVFALIWRLRWNDGEAPRRSAELQTREPWSFSTRALLLTPLLGGGILIAALLLAGLASVTDESGKHIGLPGISLAGWAEEDGRIFDVQYREDVFAPFPGWYYGVPLIICVVVLLAGLYLLLRRIAGAPRPPESGLLAADTLLRQGASEFVMLWVGMAFIAQMAGLAIISAIAFQSMYRRSVPHLDLEGMPPQEILQPGYGLGIVLVCLGLALLVAAAVLLVRQIVQLAAATRAIRSTSGMEAAR